MTNHFVHPSVPVLNKIVQQCHLFEKAEQQRQAQQEANASRLAVLRKQWCCPHWQMQRAKTMPFAPMHFVSVSIAIIVLIITIFVFKYNLVIYS